MHTRRHSLFITTMLTILMGCSAGVEDKTASIDNAAVFEVGRIEAYQTDLQSSHGALWSDIKDSNLISMVTCLKDAAIMQPIQKDEFKIHTPEGIVTRRTDENGCLRWSVYRQFDFLEKEHYSAYNIRIEGTGNHKGNSRINLAINPWIEGSTAVKDMRYDELASVHSDQMALDVMELGSSRLDLIEFNITMKEDAVSIDDKTYVITYDLSATPAFKRLNLDGNLEQINFTRGKFHLELSLLERSPSEEGLFIIAKTKSTMDIQNKKLKGKVSFSFQQGKLPKSTSVLELLVKITPVESPDKLGSIEGLISMASKERNSSSDLLKVDFEILEISGEKNKDSFVAEYQRDKEDYLENTGIGVTKDDDFAYEIDRVQLSYGSLVDGKYNKSSTKTLQANIKMCLVSANGPGSTSPVAKTDFEIAVYDQDGNKDKAERRIPTTDSNGCLDTYAYVDYDSYDCEQWLPFKIKIKAMNGKFKGLEKERVVAVNPWNPDDFGYDIKRQGTPRKIACKFPRIHIGSINYSNQELDQNALHLNKYLQLSIRKNYEFNMDIKLEQVSSYQTEKSLPPITFGNFEVRLDIYTPNKAEVDYQNPDFSDFTYITSSTADVSPNAEGKIVDKLKLPLMIHEAAILAYKNLAVLTVTSKDSKKLDKGVFYFPFHGNAEAASGVVKVLNQYEMKEKDQEKLSLISETGRKIPGVSIPGEESNISTYKLYQKHLIESGIKKDSSMKTIFMDIRDLNRSHLVPGKDNLRFGLDIEDEDFDRLANNPELVPVQTFRKLCRHFYGLPEGGIKAKGLSGLRSVEKLNDCFENPHAHMKRLPINHIVEIASTKMVTDKSGKISKVPSATFVADERGALSRGDAFFSAYGDRNALNTGERNSVQFSKSYNWGVVGPAPFLIDFNRGFSFQHENYEIQNRAKMYASFWRDYTDIRRQQLLHNSLKLKFIARVQECFTVHSITDVPMQMHICSNGERFKKMNEEWYFIADINNNKNEVISDGHRYGDKDIPQVIRGKYNFDELWQLLEKEDATIAVRKLGFIDLTDAYQPYYQREIKSLPYEKYGDNAFPGIYIPAKDARKK